LSFFESGGRLTTAEVKTEQEPSIEEILEAIRQIISEDVKGDAAKPAPAVKPAAVAPQPAAVQKAAPASPPSIPSPPAPLDLIDRVDPVKPDLQSPQPMTIEMMDRPMTYEVDDLISAKTADTVTESLSKLLAGNVAIEREDVGHTGKVTLEEMARELMKPMIKTWLDQNLPAIIEKAVQKEVEKLSRRAMDR